MKQAGQTLHRQMPLHRDLRKVFAHTHGEFQRFGLARALCSSIFEQMPTAHFHQRLQ